MRFFQQASFILFSTVSFILYAGIYSPTFGQSNDQLENLDIYLLIGQSNMAGRGEITEDLKIPVDRAFLFIGKHMEAWTPAKNPLNRFSTIRKTISMQQLGPGYGFAQGITAAQAEKEIGLVVNARGGTRIVQWLPGTHYFNEAVNQVKKALKYGELKGIIWHQGESDSDPIRTDLYLGRLEILINGFREAFDNPSLPFIAGQLAATKEQKEAFNEMLEALPDFIKHTAVISSSDTKTTDGSHFDTASQITLGQRYAEAMLKLYRE